MLDYDKIAEDIVQMLENMSKEEYIALMKEFGVELVEVEESDLKDDDNRPGPFEQMYYDFYGIDPEDEPPLESI